MADSTQNLAVTGNGASPGSAPMKQQVQANIGNAGASVSSTQVVNSNPKPAAPAPANFSSPWDEEPPFVDGPPKAAPSVFGNLDKNPVEEEKPFNLPDNLEEKVGAEKPAANYIASNRIDPQTPTQTNATPASSMPTMSSVSPVPTAPTGTVNGQGSPIVAQPVVGQQGAVPIPNAGAASNKPNLLAALLRRSKQANQPAGGPTPKPAVNQANQAPIAQIPKKSFGRLFGVVGGVLVFLAIIIFLTEMGLISIGAENFYGSFGIEKFWGGLSKDVQYSMARSALQMRAQTNYKITGTIALKVNKSTDSPVISPLLSYGYDQNFNDSQLAANPIKATKTSTDEYYVVGEDNSNDSTFGETNSNSSNDNKNLNDNTNSDETVTANSNESNTNSSGEESNAGEESSDSSNVTDVTSTLEAKVSSDSIQADFAVKNNNTEDSFTVINQDKNLFVKNGSAIVFNDSSDVLWSLFKLTSMKGDEKVQQKIFDLSSGSSFSIKGSRVKNEKMNGERCYKYHLDGVELGDLLESIGIDSSSVQGITGDVWIGVKSKLIRRISLNIVLSINSSVTNANVDLDFKDFGVQNKIELPEKRDYVEATPVKNNSNAKQGQNQNQQTATKTPDETRKSDIASMLDALKKYKADNGSYPISSSLLKLKTSGNIIEQALVPDYLAALPKDPKDAEGWYYAYKSDGRKCSISARLDDLSDPEGQIIGGVFLYLKYNME